jgi:hypothetical protein
MFCDSPICDKPFSSVVSVIILNGEVFYFNFDLSLSKSFVLNITPSFGTVVYL